MAPTATWMRRVLYQATHGGSGNKASGRLPHKAGFHVAAINARGGRVLLFIVLLYTREQPHASRPFFPTSLPSPPSSSSSSLLAPSIISDDTTVLWLQAGKFNTRDAESIRVRAG